MITKDTQQAVIEALYKRIKDLEEINDAHQKLNGKLRLEIAERDMPKVDWVEGYHEWKLQNGK